MKDVLEKISKEGKPNLESLKKLFNPEKLLPQVRLVTNPVFLEDYKKPMDAFELRALKAQAFIQKDRLFQEIGQNQEEGKCSLELELSLIWITIDFQTKMHLIQQQLVQK